MRTRFVIGAAGLLVLILLGLLLSGSRTTDNPKDSAAQPRPSKVEVGPPPTPVSATPTTTELPESRPLIRWSQVPPTIALKALPLGRLRPQGGYLVCLGWDVMLTRQELGQNMGLPAELSDLRRRALGFVIALDSVLVSELPIELESGSHTYPYEYFPTATVIPKGIPDPAAAEQKLIELLSGNMASLEAKIPKVYRHPEAVLGLRTRALLLLGSISNSPQAVDLMRKIFEEGPPEVRAASASALAFAGQEDVVKGVLETGMNPGVTAQVLSALSHGFGKYWYRIEGDRVLGTWGATTSLARGLDASVVDLSTRGEDADVRRAAALSLVARQDDPRAKMAILDHLNRADDPVLVFDMLTAGIIVDSVEMQSAIVRLFDSKEPFLRTMALYNSWRINDPAILDKIIPHLDSEDGFVRGYALSVLATAGRMDRPKAEAAMRAAMARRPQDPNFKQDVRYRIEQLYESGPSVDSIRDFLRKHPDHELR